MRNKILLLLWRAWFLRDDCIHHEGKESVARSALFLTGYEEEIKNLLLPAAGTVGRICSPTSVPGENQPRIQVSAVEESRWEKPSDGVIKINSDAAFQLQTGQCWAGAVARDHRGQVLFSACRAMSACRTAEEAEGQAVLMGITALSAMHRGDIIIETDCAMIAKELRMDSPNRSECFPVISDIKNTAMLFKSVGINAVKRCRNSLAHELAAYSRREGDRLIIANVLEGLRQLMLSECNNRGVVVFG